MNQSIPFFENTIYIQFYSELVFICIGINHLLGKLRVSLVSQPSVKFRFNETVVRSRLNEEGDTQKD